MGRPRLEGMKRDRSGRSRGPMDGVHPETIAARLRDLALDGIAAEYAFSRAAKGQNRALNALGSSTLGRLYLRHQMNESDPGSIDEAQYNTGISFGRVVHRYAGLKGIRLRVRTPSFIMVGQGSIGDLDVVDPDFAERTIAKYNNCYAVIRDQSRIYGRNLMKPVRQVCIDDMPIKYLTEIDYGDIRVALNALRDVV